jgi:hypothetical protein
VKVQFDPQEVTEKSLKSFIGEMSFTIAEERTA